MTLIEATASGKTFRRVSVGGEFMTYDEYVENLGLEREDILAKDYELAPDVIVPVTKAVFDAAWNAAAHGSLKIKPAGQSEFYLKVAKHLKLLS